MKINREDWLVETSHEGPQSQGNFSQSILQPWVLGEGPGPLKQRQSS